MTFADWVIFIVFLFGFPTLVLLMNPEYVTAFLTGLVWDRT